MSIASSEGRIARIVRLGDQMLVQQILPKLGPADEGKYIAVDIHSTDYELDESDFAAADRLRSRCPSAEIYMGRVGFPAAYLIRSAR